MSCSAQKAPGFYDGGNLRLTEEAESVSGEGCRLAVELTGCLTQINDFFFFSDGKHRLISCHILILFSSLQMWQIEQLECTVSLNKLIQSQ